jgi:Luciferase-like monooxygenase
MDPLLTLTFVAANTSRVRVGIGMLVLPSRNPVYVAALRWLSDDRFILGVGVSIPFSINSSKQDYCLKPAVDRLPRRSSRHSCSACDADATGRSLQPARCATCARPPRRDRESPRQAAASSPAGPHHRHPISRQKSRPLAGREPGRSSSRCWCRKLMVGQPLTGTSGAAKLKASDQASWRGLMASTCCSSKLGLLPVQDPRYPLISTSRVLLAARRMSACNRLQRQRRLRRIEVAWRSNLLKLWL